MCETCGCGEPAYIHSHDHDHSHNHGHSHDHDHDHSHDHTGHHHDHNLQDIHHPSDHEHLPDGRVIKVRKDILGENNLIAERNRGYLEAKKAMCINIVGSPGSGKTTLLENTCKTLSPEISLSVIEGDQQSSLDAERITKTGVKAIQINTGYGCHLDAAMVNQALKELEIKEYSITLIENVGNLVCPALFDLGEHYRIVIYSTTEGNDKPLKYPYMFRSAQVAVITKTDLIPYVDFDVDQARKSIRETNPNIIIIELSVKTGDGLSLWYDWLRKIRQESGENH